MSTLRISITIDKVLLEKIHAMPINKVEHSDCKAIINALKVVTEQYYYIGIR